MTPKQKTPPNGKTIPEIKAAAYVAILAMAVLIAAGVKAFTSEPITVTHTETRIVTSDTVIVLQKALAAMTAERDVALRESAQKQYVIETLTMPMQTLTDSLLALQRGAAETIEAVAARQALSAQARQAEDERRLARFNRLMQRVEELPDSHQIAAMLPAAGIGFLRDSPQRPIATVPPTPKTGWQLQLEPFIETGLSQQMQPSLRGGARLWLRKSKNP